MADNNKKKFTPLSLAETSAFCSQIGMILRAGISSSEGISIMLDDTKDEGEKKLLSAINDTLQATGSLYMSLEETGAFPDYMVTMVQIGEQTGKLDDVMISLSEYYEKESTLADSIRSAVTYPCIMILMMVGVILLLMMKVLPIFGQVYSQLGTSMNGLTRVIIGIGVFLNKNWLITVIILAALIAVAIYFFATAKGRGTFMGLTSKFSSQKKLTEDISSYRFASGMALTLSSGLTPEESLRLTAGLIDKGPFREKVDACIEKVSAGEDLCDSLLSCGLFSGLYTRMTSIAARTGAMDEVMAKIAARREEEIDSRISGMLAAIEPTLVIVLSVIVGVILLSVMLPLINIMTAL
ncbi:MAG: type II secretion system F family protein [Firmicutes bacterium]|nr:type II secretion system F family protein [Bacillota bacterium]